MSQQSSELCACFTNAKKLCTCLTNTGAAQQFGRHGAAERATRKKARRRLSQNSKKGGLKRRQTDAEQLYERVLKHRTCRWRKEKRKRASKDNNCLQTLGCRWNEQGKALGRMGIG